MVESGHTWSECETAGLLAKWAYAGIQRQLLGAVRNVHPFREIEDELRRQGFDQNYKQCCEKIKALKEYKETIDSLSCSSIRVDSDDDQESTSGSSQKFMT